MLPVIKKFSKLLPNFSLPILPKLNNVFLEGTITLFVLEDSPAETALDNSNISLEYFASHNLLKFISKVPKEGYFQIEVKMLGGVILSVSNISSWMSSLQNSYNQKYLPYKQELENKLTTLENVLAILSNIDSTVSLDSYTTVVGQANSLIDSSLSLIDSLTPALGDFLEVKSELEGLSLSIGALNEYGTIDEGSVHSDINNIITIYNQFFQAD